MNREAAEDRMVQTRVAGTQKTVWCRPELHELSVNRETRTGNTGSVGDASDWLES